MVGQFEPRVFVNAGMLRQFAGENISIMLCVEDEIGSNLTGLSTDDQKVTVNLEEAVGANKGDWIEIIGKSTGGMTIRGKEAILFGGDNIDFDKEGYNMMVHFLNNCKDIYRQG